jgi:hypothetical protein
VTAAGKENGASQFHNLRSGLGDGKQRQDVSMAVAADPGESCHFLTCRFRWEAGHGEHC